MSEEDLATFVTLSTHLRTLNGDFDRFDGADDNERDGIVTEDDLRAVADQQVFGGYDPATMPLPAGAIPPPPPPPYIDRGAAGMFGEDSDWAVLDDTASELKWRTIADAAELTGQVDAARHMHHYLDASGDDLILDADAMLHDVPELLAATDSVVAAEVARIVESGEYGRPIPSTSQVEPAKSANFQWGEVPDRELAELQRAGQAREYDARGSSSPSDYSGAVPDAGTEALPGPPGGRSGRDDPGRERD